MAPMRIVDPYGCFKHVNPTFMQLTGFEEDELPEKPFLAFIPPEDRHRAADGSIIDVNDAFSLITVQPRRIPGLQSAPS